MAITKADVILRFAEFTTIGDPEWAAVLGDVALQVNYDVMGTKADLASVYLTAHLLGAAHPSLIPASRVTAEAMDGTSYRYAAAQQQPSSDDLDSTPYGRLYKALIKTTTGVRFLTT